MKKIILIMCTLVSILNAAITKEELYKKMKDSQSKLYPVRFEAEIKGEIVDKQIATVPASKISGGREVVHLKFYFKQNENPSLILENVDSFYRTMFSVFDGVLATTGFYVVVGANKDFTSFSKAFLIESVSETDSYYKAVGRGKGNDNDYTVEYTINKNNMLVESATYYFKNIKKYNVSISYQELENYTLPKSIVYTSTDGVVNSSISFNNIKIYSK